MPTGFTRFEYCMPSGQVDVLNDRFQLKQERHNYGVCIRSLIMNKSQILFGRENDQTAVYIKIGGVRCQEERIEITSDVIIQNYTVISSQCKGNHLIFTHMGKTVIQLRSPKFGLIIMPTSFTDRKNFLI